MRLASEAAKEKLFARTKEVEIEGVTFRIRRLTRREYFDKLSPYLEKLMMLRRSGRPEDAVEIARLNLNYERELVKLCVMEPELGENPDEWMDGEIWLRLINAINEFVFNLPFQKYSRPQSSRDDLIMVT